MWLTGEISVLAFCSKAFRSLEKYSILSSAIFNHPLRGSLGKLTDQVLMNIECFEILGNTEHPHLSEQTYEPISNSRALLWLDRTSSAASLIGGQAQVSLAEDYRGETKGQSAATDLINDENGIGTYEPWFPTTVLALPDLCSAGQTTGETVRSQQAVRHARTAHPLRASADANAASEVDVHEFYSACVSTCLAEALGVATSQHAANERVRSDGPFKLLVRALPGYLVVPAAIVDLWGPYLTVTTSTSTASFRGKGQPSPSASLVGAIESVLPGALEGEVLSRGSVVGIAGLFRLVVTNLSTCQGEEDKHEHLPSRKRGICESKGLVARVHGSTKLRLLPPTQSGRLGVGIGKLSAMSTDPDVSVSEYQGTQCKTTLRVDRNANGTSSKPVGGELGADGAGFAPTPARNPDSTLSASDLSVSSSVPAYLGTSVANWIRNIEQEVGGRRDQVEAVVAAVAASLKRSQGAVMTSPANGLLLHGPTGAGKTLLARSVAEHSGAPWFFLDCASVFRRDRGKAEREIQDFLLKAMAQSPSIVILDQVGFISRRRPDSAGITELQVYSVLLEMMDRARHATCGPYVFFLATCPSSTALDPSLLQRGRLELVVRLGAFDSAARAHVLAIHARDMQLHVKRKSNASMQTTRPPCFSQRNRSGVCRFEDGRYAAVTENGGRHSSLRLQDVSVADDGDDDDPAAGMKEVEGKAATPRALSPTTPRTRDEFLRLVAARCHGCLGSDLERLCREAAMRHMTAVAAAESSIWSEPSRYHSANENGSERDGDCVTLEDFLAALDVVRPASLAGSSVGSFWGGGRGPEVSWTAPLVGCDAAMAELRTFILAPLTNSSLLRSLGLRPASGALLHGPPGCGKTSIARALATENKDLANFLEVTCSDLVDKVVGRSERAVSDLFAAARAAAPCVLFLDQVESVAARRGYHSSTEQTFDRILSTLLVEMDGVMTESGGHVVVIAATNDITRLDPSVLRPGRLDRRVYIGPPDLTARQSILRQRLAAMPLRYRVDGDSPACVGEMARTNESACSHDYWKVEMPSMRQNVTKLDSIEGYVEWLAGETDGASCAQITGLCREASLMALREGIGATEVAPRHFEAAIGVQLQRK